MLLFITLLASPLLLSAAFSTTLLLRRRQYATNNIFIGLLFFIAFHRVTFHYYCHFISHFDEFHFLRLTPLRRHYREMPHWYVSRYQVTFSCRATMFQYHTKILSPFTPHYAIALMIVTPHTPLFTHGYVYIATYSHIIAYAIHGWLLAGATFSDYHLLILIRFITSLILRH